MTAASSRTPRTPTYQRRGRAVPPSDSIRDRILNRVARNRQLMVLSYLPCRPRHAADSHTPAEFTVPAIVERVR